LATTNGVCYTSIAARVIPKALPHTLELLHPGGALTIQRKKGGQGRVVDIISRRSADQKKSIVSNLFEYQIFLACLRLHQKRHILLVGEK